MKILIISHYYKHKNAMASVRPIKLAKYFEQMGHDVTVLTSLQKDNWCKQEINPSHSKNIKELYAPAHAGMKYLVKVYGLIRKRGLKRLQNSKESTNQVENKQIKIKQNVSLTSHLKNKLTWLFYYSSDRLENHFLAQGLINKAKSEQLKDFDVVIATYPGAGVHAAGEWFKKKKRTKFYIADYRDPAYNPGARSNKVEAKHDKAIQDKAIKYSDAIVCVSEGMADNLRSQYTTLIPNVYVVKNGFDSEDNKNSIRANFDPTKFNFVYTGALYQGRRTVDMLAQVLRSNIENGLISQNDIAINYAGPDFSELINQLKPYNLESIAVDYGYVSREQSLGMQEEADMVLLLNWNDTNYTGVIPGKLYEYMSSKKTICALIMGNQAGSESAKMIESYGLGCACEQASPNDIQKLYLYIESKLKDFKQGIRNGIDSDYIKHFEYKNIAKEYLEVIGKLK